MQKNMSCTKIFHGYHFDKSYFMYVYILQLINGYVYVTKRWDPPLALIYSSRGSQIVRAEAAAAHGHATPIARRTHRRRSQRLVLQQAQSTRFSSFCCKRNGSMVQSPPTIISLDRRTVPRHRHGHGLALPHRLCVKNHVP
jgi:hypothetical protein